MSHNNAELPQKRRYVKLSGNYKQRRAAKLVSEVIRDNNTEISKGEILLRAGYSETQALKPSVVTNSVGFKVELAKLGLTDELVVPMLVQDLENNPNKRWLGLSIAGKWLGLERKGEDAKPTNTLINNAIIIIQAPDSKGQLKDIPQDTQGQ